VRGWRSLVPVLLALGLFGSLAAVASARVPVIAAAGDIACDPKSSHYNRGNGSPVHCRQGVTSNMILRSSYRAVLALGDLQYQNGRLWKFRRSYGSSWGRFKPKTIPVIGNHEYGTPNARSFFTYFNGRGRRDGKAGHRRRGWSGLDLGRWHIVVLNSNCGQISCGPRSREAIWLRRNLQHHPNRCVLAAYHHPRYSSGVHEEYQKVSTFWSILYRAGVDVVLNGHDHDYERFAPQGTRHRLDRTGGVVEFVVGTGGHSLFNLGKPAPNTRASQDKRFGFLRMRLGRGRYGWAFKAAPNGHRLDAGSHRCTPIGPLVRRYLRAQRERKHGVRDASPAHRG
jgi:hypothetical protein